MLVSQNDKMLHFIHPMQFLDSSDWFQVSSDDIFQVNFIVWLICPHVKRDFNRWVSELAKNHGCCFGIVISWEWSFKRMPSCNQFYMKFWVATSFGNIARQAFGMENNVSLIIFNTTQVREKVASYNGSPPFKTNLMNNMLFVESEKPLNLLSAFNPKNANKVDKSLENVYKLLQVSCHLKLYLGAWTI